MRKKLLAQSMLSMLGLTLATSVYAGDETLTSAVSERGFSFFLGAGREQLIYSEKSRNPLTPVKSSATVANPLLITGALYPVSADLLFSMTNATTFYPGEATERWNATGTTSNFGGNGTSVAAGQLLQTNSFTLSQSNTEILAHYRLRDQLFVVGGPSLRTQTFKRYSFQPAATGSTVEESASEVVINVGLALESEKVRGAPNHYGVRLTAGVPAWRRVRNTTVPDLEFTSAKGWDAAVEGRYSHAVYHGVHLGIWAKWAVSERDSEILRFNAGGSSELPDSRLENRSIGIELLWKL